MGVLDSTSWVQIIHCGHASIEEEEGGWVCRGRIRKQASCSWGVAGGGVGALGKPEEMD